MPFDVAMEQPDTRVICSEPQDHVAVRSHHNGITAHWYLGEGFVVDIGTGLVGGPDDCLEGVAMEMEGMFTGVVIVEDNLDDLILFEYEGIGVGAVDFWVSG